MGRPLYRLTGRSRMKRRWTSPWRRTEEFEVYMVFWSSGFFWYSRKEIQDFMPSSVRRALPE